MGVNGISRTYLARKMSGGHFSEMRRTTKSFGYNDIFWNLFYGDCGGIGFEIEIKFKNGEADIS